MALACYPEQVKAYDKAIGQHYKTFSAKLDQFEDFAVAISAIAMIIIICLPQTSHADVAKKVLTAISATFTVTTLFLVTFKLEGIITGRTCYDIGKGKPKNGFAIMAEVASSVGKIASALLVLHSLGVFSLGAHYRWIATTAAVSTCTMFALLVLDTINNNKEYNAKKKAQLAGRIFYVLAIPGTFKFIAETAPPIVRATFLGISALGFGFNAFKECFTFKDPEETSKA